MSETSLEALQKKAKNAYLLAIFLSAALFFAIISVLFFLLLTSPSGIVYLKESPAEMLVGLLALPALLCVGLYGLIYCLFVRRTYETFNRAFKQTYVLQTIYTLGGFDKLNYSPAGGFSYNEIRDSFVVNSGEYKYFKSEDQLSGTLFSIPFSYCDVVTQYLKRSGKKSEIRTIFQGQIIRFSLPEDSKWSFGHLQIFEKEFLSSFKGRTAPCQIQTEQEAFNKRFEVFAADEHNAFYLLTPRMMEQITRFADFAHCQIDLTFVGASLYVAVDRPHNMFNASVRQPLKKQRQLILEDGNLLKKAGEMLIFGTEASSINNQE